jgi:hypothetical protein
MVEYRDLNRNTVYTMKLDAPVNASTGGKIWGRRPATARRLSHNVHNVAVKARKSMS